jgi:hypothetical protein
MLRTVLYSGIALVAAQSEMRFFLTPSSYQPGAAYDGSNTRFRSVSDMDQICMDQAPTAVPSFEAHWEFQAFACDSNQPSLKPRWTNFETVPLTDLSGGNIVSPNFRRYFAEDGCADCWDGHVNPLAPTQPFPGGFSGDLAPLPAGYVGERGTVVTQNVPDRYFWHACDEYGMLIEDDTVYPPEKGTCRDWTSNVKEDEGLLEDIGVSDSSTPTDRSGFPGHEKAGLPCDVTFVHIMCLQVINATPQPTTLSLPLFIFVSTYKIKDDKTQGKVVITNLGGNPAPEASLQGIELLDWICNNDQGITPNLQTTVANGGNVGAGILTHGPYLAVACNNENNPNFSIERIDKGRFLATGSRRPIVRWIGAPDRTNAHTEWEGKRNFEGGSNPIASYPHRTMVANNYQHFFNSESNNGCDFTNPVTHPNGVPTSFDDCTGCVDELINPVVDPLDTETPKHTFTGCSENAEFENDADCNSFHGSPIGTPVDEFFLVKYWNNHRKCTQYPVPKQECHKVGGEMSILCLELAAVTAVVRGDPHFISFSGGSYDVHGESGKIYNIISDKYIQFNSQFVAGTRHATYMGAIGIIFNNHTIWWQASLDNRTRNEKVLLDGSVLPKNRQVSLIDADDSPYSVTFQKESKKHTPRLEIVVPGYRMEFTYKHAPRRQYGRNMLAANYYRPHYLDHKVVHTYEPGHQIFPHGLLGQTARHSTAAKQKKNTKNGEGVIEGTYDEYEVKDIFGVDFKYNQFQPKYKWNKKVH